MIESTFPVEIRPSVSRGEHWLSSLAAGTGGAGGEDCLPNLVRHLADSLGLNRAFAAEVVAPNRVRTLAYWLDGKLVDNIEYDPIGTPCAEVIDGKPRHFSTGVPARFSNCTPGTECYIGFPLVSREGDIFGHLCASGTSRLDAGDHEFSILKIYAARATAELDRLRTERRLRESEERLRDLIDEAPIAYVHEAIDTRFIRANRAAMKVLGLDQDEVEGTFGNSFIPETPSARRRFDEAIAAMEKGMNTSGKVLELRRKDGAPLWVQWWSKPDSSGRYTRSMFVDITAQVTLHHEQERLHAQNLYLQEEIKATRNFEEIIGASPALRKVLDRVSCVAPTDASVLICGETGTGKELIARAIHASSARSGKPFIKVNCAALPAGLVESELFGHERGAFTGAIQRRIGRFDLAHGGTIFLDEIGDMPKDVQVKLLRVLQERQFERVGGSQTIDCDVRVISATNRILETALKEGEFRADLYYRLNVFPLHMPSLRERKSDIPLLVQYFAQKHGKRVGRQIDGVAAETMERLVAYRWPGNIRELENIIERALILSTGNVLRIEPEVMGMSLEQIEAPQLVAEAVTSAVDESGASGNLDFVQRQHISNTLRETSWIIEGERGAAVRLGLKPATLRHRMKKLGIMRSM